MTKQEEIREFIDIELAALTTAVLAAGKSGLNPNLGEMVINSRRKLLFDFVSKGVVIKVDRELPQCPECGDKGWRPLTEEEQRHCVTASKTVCPRCSPYAGCVAVGSLI